MVPDIAWITWSITPTSGRKHGTIKQENVNRMRKYYSHGFLPVVHLRIERMARDDGQEIMWVCSSATVQVGDKLFGYLSKMSKM